MRKGEIISQCTINLSALSEKADALSKLSAEQALIASEMARISENLEKWLTLLGDVLQTENRCG